MDRNEQIITNETTGASKASKLARFDLIPPGPLTALAEHYGRGAQKYEDRNWERGYEWGLSYAALMRHLQLWWGGEDIDEETGSNHLDAVMWHAFALREFVDTHPELDDRQRPFNPLDLLEEKSEEEEEAIGPPHVTVVNMPELGRMFLDEIRKAIELGVTSEERERAVPSLRFVTGRDVLDWD